MPKKAAVAVADDEIEELDEVEATAEASTEAAPKKARAKKEKPARAGMSTKEAAESLGITPVRLRRILRTEDGGFPDKEYTRYDLSNEIVEHVRGLLASGAAEKAARPRKAKTEKVENAAEEVSDELEDLEDIEESDEDELELEDEDEEES